MAEDRSGCSLLDRVPGASAAFGLRRLRLPSSGDPVEPIIRLTREADGESACFGGGDNGALDLAAVARFLGDGGGRCDAWYDQSGHHFDAEALGAAPLFCAPQGEPAPLLRFRPPATLRSPLSLEGISAFSIFAVFRAAHIAAATSVARWQSEGDFVVFPYHTGEALTGVHNTSIERVPLGVVPGEFVVYGVVWQQRETDGFSSYRNGSLVATQAARDAPVAVRDEPLFIGSYAGRGEHFTGDLAELVIWPRALSADEIRIVSEEMRRSHALQTATRPCNSDRDCELDRRAREIFELDESGLARLGMQRVAGQINDILDDPRFTAWPLDRQLSMVERIREIFTGHWHAGGRSLIPGIERAFHRALVTPEVTLDALCLFYDLLYFLYWYMASEYEAMRGVAEQAMQPFAAAIRDAQLRELPTTRRRPPSGKPPRLGYLAQFARRGDAVGRLAHAMLGALSRCLPGTYDLFLYAWGEYDEAAIKALADAGIRVRHSAAKPTAARIAAIAEAITSDEIDILITDMNTALPTVLFERRAAPVQIFLQAGLPFWPITNLDGVFQLDEFDPKWRAFPQEKCFRMALGPWHPADYAPAVNPARLAAERARLPSAAKLGGTYVRLAKITPEFLDILATLLGRHKELAIVLGGVGDGTAIREFIATRDLGGRLVLVEEWIDGHAWGHLLDVFLDTFPLPGGIAGREVMAKGRPVVTMRVPWIEGERVPMLIADDPPQYVEIVSRLIADPDFYKEACAATRGFVAAQPGEAEYAVAIHNAVDAVMRPIREGPPGAGVSGVAMRPEDRERALTARIEKIQAFSNDDVARIGMDSVAAEIRTVLGDPVFAAWPPDRQLPVFRRIYEVYGGHWHASGPALIPAIEPFFRRALATPGIALEVLCVFYDLLYHLYFFDAGDYNLMQGAADRVMAPFAAAVRAGAIPGVPKLAQRPLGTEPLRLGYLCYFPDWIVGPTAQGMLLNLARHFPGAYRLTLYAWGTPDNDWPAKFADSDIVVRRFTAAAMTERIAAAAQAIADDEIDILISDMNMALPTVLFEQRAAPVQIFVQVGLPFWPISNVDGVFLLDELEPEWEAFPPEKCFRMDLGSWDLPEYAPPVDPARVTAERARMPPAPKLVGTYVRFAKVTPAFLDVIAELLGRHLQLAVVLGGIGDAAMIREHIGTKGLAGRLVLFDEWVDGHVWGHMLDVFLDTFPIPGGVAGREVMVKGRPVVSMRLPWVEGERVTMLTADDAEGYVAIVSRLIEDPAFYEAACAATREFVAARPNDAQHAEVIKQAIAAVVRLTDRNS